MVEIAAEKAAEAANELIKEEIRQSAEVLAAQPTVWEKAREFARVSACDHLYEPGFLDFEEMEMADKAVENVKAQELGKRMERAYKELGINSPEELESRQFLTAANIEQMSAYRYMKEPLANEKPKNHLAGSITMEEFIQKTAKGEL